MKFSSPYRFAVEKSDELLFNKIDKNFTKLLEVKNFMYRRKLFFNPISWIPYHLCELRIVKMLQYEFLIRT